MSDREMEYREFASARARPLFRLAFLICGDWHEAEDLVQTTLASLFVAWNRLRRRDSMDLPDGSIERDAVENADEYGFYGYSIYDQRPDGITVFIQVANGTNHLRPQVGRPRPPGSMAAWEAVAENPAW